MWHACLLARGGNCSWVSRDGVCVRLVPPGGGCGLWVPPGECVRVGCHLAGVWVSRVPPGWRVFFTCATWCESRLPPDGCAMRQGSHFTCPPGVSHGCHLTGVWCVRGATALRLILSATTDTMHALPPPALPIHASSGSLVAGTCALDAGPMCLPVCWQAVCC